MGKMIVSWSPIHGQGATTSNIAALAATFAMNYKARNLITHTQLKYSSLESLFGKQMVSEGFEDRGMSALERLVKSGLLKPEAVMDYTETIYSKRLDLLGGDNDSDVNPELLETLLMVTNNAYDLVWVDAHSGNRNALTNRLLEKADIVLINLPANRFILDRFFKGDEFPTILKDKPYIVLISSYDTNSSLSIRKIKRDYRIKNPVIAIPYCRQFHDATNRQTLSEFFYFNNTPIKTSPVEPFINSLNQVIKLIAKQSGFKTSQAQDEEDDE